jgi:two-component system sensor kinase FixL
MEDHSLPPISHYDELPVAVFICDKNDFLTAFNPAASSLLDIPPQTGQKNWYPSCTIFDSNGERLNNAFQLVNNGIKANRREHRQEILICLPGGSTRNIWVSSVAVCNKAQQYLGAIHILTDITFQRELESYKSLLFSIIESCEDAIISKGLDGTITSWNPAAQKMFGYTEKEAIGRNISLIIPDDHLADERLIIEKIKKGEKVDHFQTVRITSQGKQLPLSLTISPIMDSKGHVIGASKIARDISLQKKAEEHLKRYAARLEELVEERTRSLKENVGKLEITKDELSRSLKKERELGELKSRFVSMASHEFRTRFAGSNYPLP